jgi:hypothetical protein
MVEQISLNKQVFSKTQYERVIDTSFTQLVEPTPISSLTIPSISVAEFFLNYQDIFYQIPKFGDVNSHFYLVKTSGEYIGNTQNDDIIQALIDEINQLRQQNLELQTSQTSQTLTSVQETLKTING